MNRKFFACACFDTSHHFAVALDDETKDSYFQIHLCQHKSFFQRLILAFKYLFNLDTNDSWGHYAEIILSEETTNELIEFLKQNG